MTLVERLGELGQKQRVRLTLEDGMTIEGRINQSVYSPDDALRLELLPEESAEYRRYQVLARFEDGTWGPVRVRGSATDSESLTDVGAVADVTPLETYRTPKSSDMEAQDETGTDE